MSKSSDDEIPCLLQCRGLQSLCGVVGERSVVWDSGVVGGVSVEGVKMSGRNGEMVLMDPHLINEQFFDEIQCTGRNTRKAKKVRLCCYLVLSSFLLVLFCC